MPRCHDVANYSLNLLCSEEKKIKDFEESMLIQLEIYAIENSKQFS